MQRWKYQKFSTGLGDGDGHNHQDLRTMPQQLAVATSPDGAMHLSLQRTRSEEKKHAGWCLRIDILTQWNFQ